jgi:hypothetical protein
MGTREHQQRQERDANQGGLDANESFSDMQMEDVGLVGESLVLVDSRTRLYTYRTRPAEAIKNN